MYTDGVTDGWDYQKTRASIITFYVDFEFRRKTVCVFIFQWEYCACIQRGAAQTFTRYVYAYELFLHIMYIKIQRNKTMTPWRSRTSKQCLVNNILLVDIFKLLLILY